MPGRRRPVLRLGDQTGHSQDHHLSHHRDDARLHLNQRGDPRSPTAAGLSTFAFVVGPLFYLAHETARNYFGPANTVDLPALSPLRRDGETPPAGRKGLTISRALAKTIAFRTIATAMDFTTIYVVVGDLATAIPYRVFI